QLKELQHKETALSRTNSEETEELRKIKKVQSFFRGWLCRRRWKNIVEEYIRSEHAEHMRKRNNIVFGLVECEEEYVQQITILVSCFLRPCRMAASAKKPIITHEDVNSIFLNAETLLFLHQIFLQGLNSKMDNWPTLQLGDLFDMLLPMLSIYQEYVRNHHYSLQVLAEYKQKAEFTGLLKRYEEKSLCEGRSMETFLTYPMHQIPRYIVTLHELLAHTPHDHVDRQQLEFAKSKLEDLSHAMHDEVSETENIRKNLAIERMIVEGCDILLDVNQIFVRQGCLTQLPIGEKGRNTRPRIGSFSSTFNKDSRKEAVRQVFLFTNHLILTTRASNGRLHLVKTAPLNQLTVEAGQQRLEQRAADYSGLDFRLIVDFKSGPPVTITLVANSAQEKAAWCSDINQCIEQIHYSDLLNSSLAETSLVSMPHTIRSDPKLFRDDVDIKFSRTLNSCKVPQRLLDRLTDLRFLSIDFLNTFLLTYRVFTEPKTVISALKRILTNPEYGNLDPRPSICLQSSLESETGGGGGGSGGGGFLHVKPELDKLRRISTGMMRLEASQASAAVGARSAGPSGVGGGGDGGGASSSSGADGGGGVDPYGATHRTGSLDAGACERLAAHHRRRLQPPPAGPPSYGGATSGDPAADPPEILRELSEITAAAKAAARAAKAVRSSPQPALMQTQPAESPPRMPLARMAPIASCETMLDEATRSSLSDSSGSEAAAEIATATAAAEAKTVGVRRVRISGVTETEVCDSSSPPSPQRQPPASPTIRRPTKFDVPSMRIPESQLLDHTSLSPGGSPQPKHRLASPCHSPGHVRRATSPTVAERIAGAAASIASRLGGATSPISHSASSPTVNQSPFRGSVASGSGGPMKRTSCAADSTAGDLSAGAPSSGRPSLARSSDVDSPPCRAKAGAVVTSSRASKRRSSNTAAALAFAAATAGASTLPKSSVRIAVQEQESEVQMPQLMQHRPSESSSIMVKRLSIICTAATMRVLNVVRHWVYKFGEDIESDPTLRADMIDLLEDLVCNQNLFPPDHKAALQILLKLREEPLAEADNDLERILTPAWQPSFESFETLSALDIAEQITLIDHKLFRALKSAELITQAWMKKNPEDRASSTVLQISKRFNATSCLVVSEIISCSDIDRRVACIEKWAAIADICRCLHNYNGVLQICAALVNSSVFRLKKTWERLSKSTRQMIDRLQLLVSSDGRFKNMRSALHNCDPPCIPYLGMYLTDLSFIEEGTSNVTEEGLINFCKMRMIAHIIREIQQFQQTPYRIEHNQRVCDYLLDTSRLIEDERAYAASLLLEPRVSICPESSPQTPGGRSGFKT
uniref:Ras-specific guanine nucleotide-releasing factor 2 n=1 Tax=Macrostomum lignano TaxID=282301 RepID=A0A1I8IW63_9PLAT